MTRNRDQFTRLGKYLFNQSSFLDKCAEQPTGCITWQGAQHRQGYGMVSGYRVSDNKRIMQVSHRVSMMFKLKRELHHDEFVIHTCENNLCVNPEHLIIGDYYAKDRVMIAKGHVQHRHRGAKSHLPPRRQQNRRYRYTDDEIRYIRQADTRDLARIYNITRQAASKLRYECRIRYRWLK